MKQIFFWFCMFIVITAQSQSVGSRVSFKGTDGKTYTAVIKEIRGDQYHLKYEGYDYEAWAQKSQFTVINGTADEVTVGTKVSFPGTDGKTYTGSIREVNGEKYLIKYDGYDFEAWVVRSQFTPAGANANTTTTTTNAPVVNTAAAGEGKPGNWQVGDKVQVRSYTMDKFENATIYAVLTDRNPPQYKARLDNPGAYALTDMLLSNDQIRSRNAKPTFNISVGTRVDGYFETGSPRARGTVIETEADGRFKVHYDGCAAHWDEIVDWSQLKPASVIAANDPDITAVFGKWAMFVYSYPNTTVRGNDVYREYGTGAKAPPLQINADGSYVWYDEFNKPPVKGTWITHAKIAGVTTGTETVNGIIIKDSRGNQWKVHKDREDHIEARLMCSGQTEGGTRIK